MKEDFLVIDHNGMLRILFLKCNTLLKLKEYSNKKNLNQILKENTTVNTILDKKGNDIKIEEIEKNKTLESTPVPTPPSPYSVKIIEKNKTLENEIIETNKNIIFSPRKETQMVTIELNENKKDIIVEIEKTEEEINEMEDEINEKKANEKFINGCNFCSNGCDLICTGFSYMCSCFGYYMGKLYKNIKKCFN